MAKHRKEDGGQGSSSGRRGGLRWLWHQLGRPIYQGHRRQTHLVVCFVCSIAVALVAGALTFLNIVQARGIVTVTTAALAACGVWIAYSAREYREVHKPAVAMLAVVALSMTYYAVAGVNEGFAILWTLVVPLAFCYFIGVRTGILLSAYFLVLVCLLFWTPLRDVVGGAYTATFVSRFPFLFALNFMLTTIAMVSYHLASLAEAERERSLEREARAKEREAKAQARNAQRSAHSLEVMSVGLVETLVAAIDAKDRYTNGHSERVAQYSSLLAHELGWDEDEAGSIYHEGLLHDVGKIGVPDAVLNKPGKLTDVEYERIKAHTTVGYSILSRTDGLQVPSLVARHHHERWDGAGYPDGLAGTEIPLHARVVAVADAYDAMRSDRVYRAGLSRERVRAELARGRGTQFDPEVVDAMLRLIDAGAL